MGNIFFTNLSDELVVKSPYEKPIKDIGEKIKKITFDSKCYENPKILLSDNFTVETICFLKKYSYHGSLENLPPNLINLFLTNNYYARINNFPPFLQVLYCSDEFFIRQTNIPDTLKKLKIVQSSIIPDDDYNGDYYNGDDNSVLSLPKNLEELEFSYDYTDRPNNTYVNKLTKLFNNLPKKLKILKIPNFWNEPLLNLPTSLEKLYLGIQFNQPLDLLPESIKLIEFPEGYKFNKPVDNLPSQLEYLNLQFQNKYTHTISNLPDSIKYLEIGEYELEIGKLPTKLNKLVIASPVKFDFVEYEIVKVSGKENINNCYYKLMYIGRYNIDNKILISIPPNLSSITWWDGDMSVYTYIKCSNNDLWYKQK